MKTFYQHLESAGITFGATFFLFLGITISAQTFTFSRDAIVAATLGALTAAVRAIALIIVEIAKEYLSKPKE